MGLNRKIQRFRGSPFGASIGRKKNLKMFFQHVINGQRFESGAALKMNMNETLHGTVWLLINMTRTSIPPNKPLNAYPALILVATQFESGSQPFSSRLTQSGRNANFQTNASAPNRGSFLMSKLLAFFCLFCLTCAHGQALPSSPSTEQMIEQLKVQPPATGRTRSFRNLDVVAVPPPSLSLQIQFDFNSARVSPESQQALSNLAQAMQSPELKSANFRVEGHTDAKGKADYNLKLSQMRADAVKDFLVAQSVDAARLTTAGKGSKDLANAADPYAAENRRVRIVNITE
jgi:outer membrane protein OmpA-like peptidoglycan-associated protein